MSIYPFAMRETDRQTDRQKDRQTDRQTETERETVRQRDRETERDREREICFSQSIVFANIYSFLNIFSIDFEKCGVTPQCLYPDSLTVTPVKLKMSPVSFTFIL